MLGHSLSAKYLLPVTHDTRSQPTRLRLDTRLGLIPQNRRYSRRRPVLPNVVFDDRVLPGETLLLNLTINSGSTEPVIGDSALDIFFIVVEFAWLADSRSRRGRCPGNKVFSYSLAIKPSLLGNLADVQPPMVEVSNRAEILRGKHCHNLQVSA